MGICDKWRRRWNIVSSFFKIFGSATGRTPGIMSQCHQHPQTGLTIALKRNRVSKLHEATWGRQGIWQSPRLIVRKGIRSRKHDELSSWSCVSIIPMAFHAKTAVHHLNTKSRNPNTSGAGTNLKVGGGIRPVRSAGNFFWSRPPFLALKV